MRFFDILQWTVVAAIVVVVVVNAKSVASAITAFGEFWVSETQVLTTANAGGYPVPKVA